MLSHTSRLFRISSNVPRGSLGKICGGRPSPSLNRAFVQNQLFPKNSTPWTQFRASSLLSKTTPVKQESAITIGRIAYAVKLVRFPFLLVAISTLGYQRGATDAIRNPLKLQQAAFEAMLREFSVDSTDEVEIVTERGVRSRFDTPLGSLGHGKLKTNDPRSEKIAMVGRQILKSAQTYVRENFEEAVEKAKELIAKDGVDLDERELARRLNDDPDVQFWINALEHVEGASLDGIQNWSYVLISSPIPNAFVSEMLPHKVFVTTGLFDKFVNNDDELAMILGHEVSHLIKGHFTTSSNIETWIRGVEIFALMLDPTEGLLSLGVASFLSSAREALVAAFSRSNETEADELGLRLAAMSCYDTKRGIQVYRKMEKAAVSDGTAPQHSFMSSHPPSGERYEHLHSMVETENFSQYSYCNTLQKRIARALKSRESYKSDVDK
eukprot:CAMPEP_0116117340 /NCGR_PEP_ID=MMETSP0329-20121206/1517_1 /TAXON_ID=697910 /ORGANISM="Pseudo-nitzschia arenysensis, Strain B593" /LENGTH=438 /DNA_ID=CAMNT_0003610891 /DNA_START=113 /DNA_END=1429 /DNA_ORIENTATION=-